MEQVQSAAKEGQPAAPIRIVAIASVVLAVVFSTGALSGCAHSSDSAPSSEQSQAENTEPSATEENPVSETEPSENNEGGGSSTASSQTDAGITALDFIIAHKSDLSDDDIYDLNALATETSNDIWMAQHDGAEQIENEAEVNALLETFARTLAAIAKKYDVAVTGTMTESDFESIRTMLSNAFLDTPRAQEAVA